MKPLLYGLARRVHSRQGELIPLLPFYKQSWAPAANFSRALGDFAAVQMHMPEWFPGYRLDIVRVLAKEPNIYDIFVRCVPADFEDEADIVDDLRQFASY